MACPTVGCDCSFDGRRRIPAVLLAASRSAPRGSSGARGARHPGRQNLRLAGHSSHRARHGAGARWAPAGPALYPPHGIPYYLKNTLPFYLIWFMPQPATAEEAARIEERNIARRLLGAAWQGVAHAGRHRAGNWSIAIPRTWPERRSPSIAGWMCWRMLRTRPMVSTRRSSAA